MDEDFYSIDKYMIDEAAEILNVPIVRLLHYADEGKIALLLPDSEKDGLPRYLYSFDAGTMRDSFDKPFDVCLAALTPHEARTGESLGKDEEADDGSDWEALEIYMFSDLRAENLFVSKNELERCKSILEGNDEEALDYGFPVEGFHSDKLRAVLLASRVFWGHPKINRDDTTTFPENDDIREWLLQRGFSARAAEIVPTLLRPDWGIKKGRTRKK